MKKFITDESFWQLFPDAQIGIVVARGMKSTDEVPAEDMAEIARMLDHANLASDKWLTEPQLSNNEVVAVWREAYRKFKTKKGARCSIENLLKRASKGNPVGHITPLVDIYNALSLRYALPFGAEDVDTFQGDLVLKVTEGGDAFDPLGEGNEPTLPGELAYIDDAGAVCRCWNWRDGQRTAIRDDSKNAFIIIECVDPSRVDDLKKATDELAGLVERYLGADIFAKEQISSTNREMVIEP
jgi:DNA/RNA-binding domain of Phe-tRNA-synthetase-like protein